LNVKFYPPQAKGANDVKAFFEAKAGADTELPGRGRGSEAARSRREAETSMTTAGRWRLQARKIELQEQRESSVET